MKLKDAEDYTLSVGELEYEFVQSNQPQWETPQYSHNPGKYEIPLVVKVGGGYLRVRSWDLKTRQDGSKVFIIHTVDKT